VLKACFAMVSTLLLAWVRFRYVRSWMLIFSCTTKSRVDAPLQWLMITYMNMTHLLNLISRFQSYLIISSPCIRKSVTKLFISNHKGNQA
jgi:hypothetical protein